MTREAPSTRPASRSQRKRKVAERVRKVDRAALREAQQRRLDALEDDNHAVEAEAAVLADEPEYNPGEDSDEELALGSSKPKRRARASRNSTVAKARSKAKPGIEKWNKSLAQALEEEDVSKRPKGMVHYDEIAARPSTKPPRPFCSVCGYHAAYTCTRCYVRFCSVPCGNVHSETRCLKFTT